MTDLHPRAADQVDRELAALVARRPGAQVLDVGGGSGTRAVPLAVLGCTVIVVDESIDALAILRRRAAESGVAGRVRGIQADADALDSIITDGGADLVLCHNVLESVDDPASVVRSIAGALRPGGTVSVLAAGRHAALLAQALSGRFVEAAALLTDPDGRHGAADPVRHRFDVVTVTALLEDAGLVVDTVSGISVVSGLVSGAVRQAHPQSAGQLESLDAALGRHPVFRELAADLHVLAHRPGP